MCAAARRPQYVVGAGRAFLKYQNADPLKESALHCSFARGVRDGYQLSEDTLNA